MPANQTQTEGNDDQVFWAFAALDAAELNFPAPTAGYPSWLAMAQAVFNEQADRWDTSTCGGGLRWQIFTWNNGYNYKNVASNGGFFQLSSRLARYTGNTTYVHWAEKAWDWFEQSVLLDNATYNVYDGTSDVANCTAADHTQWSYNYGLYMAGLAYLYNHVRQNTATLQHYPSPPSLPLTLLQTENTKYLTPLTGILNTTLTTFFPPKMGPEIMVEVACEPSSTCDVDDFTFKSFTLRWLGLVTQLAPTLAPTITPYLQTSGKGAAGQCSGGTDGMTCGFEWNTTTWDGTYGVGQQMSALSAIQVNMINVAGLKAPYTSATGGTSKSDPSAGSTTGGTISDETGIYTSEITTADRAGAGILTALLLVGTLGGAGWMIVS